MDRSVRIKNAVFAALGGISGTVLDVIVLVLLVEHGVAVPLAAFLGSAAGAGCCFLVNKYWAFRDATPVTLRQLSAFGVVAVGTALLMAVGMAIVANGMGVPYLLAKAVCAAAVFFAWSFPVQRRFVFRATSSPSLSIDPAQSLA